MDNIRFNRNVYKCYRAFLWKESYSMMSTDNTMISAKDIFQYLIKEVFGTYSFPDTKWCCVWDIPDIGRTYFQDRKDKECPFNRECIEKMKLLYNGAINGKMKISERTVTVKLCNLFQNVFRLNYTFLVYYEDDSESLRMAKKSCWLLLLESILEKLEDKPNIGFLEYIEIFSEHSAICQRIERVSEETYTGIILAEMQRPEKEEKVKLARKVAKEIFVSGTDYEIELGKPIFRELYKPHKGMVLFFLNSSIANVMEFTTKFTSYSNLKISKILKYKCSVEDYPLPEEKGTFCISYNEWNEKRDAGQICVLYENKFLCSGYDIDGIHEGIENGISYVCEGSCNDYLKCKEAFPNMSLFLVIPEKINRLILETECRGYYLESAKVRYNTVKDNIDFAIKNQGYVIRWQSEKDDRLTAYYAGLIDSIITANPMTQQLNTTFLMEYMELLKELIGE